MSKVYVVQSSEGHYYSKHHEWLTGKEANRIFFGKYKDEALNQLIDITLKDVNIRAKVVETILNERNLPVLEVVAQFDLTDNPELSVTDTLDSLQEDFDNIATA
jgi:hypothetical protein